MAMNDRNKKHSLGRSLLREVWIQPTKGLRAGKALPMYRRRGSARFTSGNTQMAHLLFLVLGAFFALALGFQAAGSLSHTSLCGGSFSQCFSTLPRSIATHWTLIV
jgi:hypothetical protein